MARKRYLIEIGTGIDMHGGDTTKAAVKAINDAMSHCCMAGIQEILMAEPEDLALNIKICCPNPEHVNLERLREPVRFYPDVKFELAVGGAIGDGLHVPKFTDGDQIVVANAIITVYAPAPA